MSDPNDGHRNFEVLEVEFDGTEVKFSVAFKPTQPLKLATLTFSEAEVKQMGFSGMEEFQALVRETIEEMEQMEKEKAILGVLFEKHQVTPREADVAFLATKGMSNREIADELELAEQTVKQHLVSVFGKFHITSRVQLVRRCMEFIYEGDRK